MDYLAKYEKWLTIDEESKQELSSLSDEEIRERFYKDLEFGTGGIRGIMGAGTNRMNKYVVRRASKGVANSILKQENKSVAIAYDSRNNSAEFARVAADVFTSMGITVYLFESLRPTPELSFTVRHLKTTAGIVITASHNPKEYNGYKVYWSDGGQIPPSIADEILAEINKIDIFEAGLPKNDELLTYIGEDVDKEYLKAVYKQAVNPDAVKKVADTFKLVYSPLHGSGSIPVQQILKKSGFKNVYVVSEQEMPDGNFSTVKSPNPENKECFEIAIELAKKNGVDLILATDPDCDRVGIVVKDDNGQYVTMTGNQVGILLTNYILENINIPSNGAVITTIVSTKMIDKLCEHYGVKLFRTLTGFKYIGEKIHEFEINGEHEFIFGFEESYGYLSGTYCRDKDAVVASMLIAEMAAYYAQKGKTLYNVMQDVYKKFGFYNEKLVSITLDGENGIKKIQSIMSTFRGMKSNELCNANIIKVTDYLKETSLPKSDVLCFGLDNGVDILIRPSGTEPKIKIYFLATDDKVMNETADLFCGLCNSIISDK